MASRLQSVCVFCGSRTGVNPAFAETARAVGRTLAERGLRLVYGGGSVGLMGEIADGALEAGGEVIGIITTYLKDRELGHPGIARLEVVETMLERKDRMAQLSDAFLSLPGGIGTLDELFEMLTWTRLRIHRKPNGVLNVEGFYDPLLSFLFENQVQGGFIGEKGARNLLVDDTIEGILGQLDAAAAEADPVTAFPAS